MYAYVNAQIYGIGNCIVFYMFFASKNQVQKICTQG